MSHRSKASEKGSFRAVGQAVTGLVDPTAKPLCRPKFEALQGSEFDQRAKLNMTDEQWVKNVEKM